MSNIFFDLLLGAFEMFIRRCHVYRKFPIFRFMFVTFSGGCTAGGTAWCVIFVFTIVIVVIVGVIIIVIRTEVTTMTCISVNEKQSTVSKNRVNVLCTYSLRGVSSSASVASVTSDLAVSVALLISLEGTSTIGVNVSFSRGFFLVSSSDQKSSSAIIIYRSLDEYIKLISNKHMYLEMRFHRGKSLHVSKITILST